MYYERYIVEDIIEDIIKGLNDGYPYDAHLFIGTDKPRETSSDSANDEAETKNDDMRDDAHIGCAGCGNCQGNRCEDKEYVDEDGIDPAATVLDDVIVLVGADDDVAEILGDSKFKTSIDMADDYDTVSVSVNTPFGFSTAAGKTYPYNIANNPELLKSIVFDLVTDIVIEFEGHNEYMNMKLAR